MSRTPPRREAGFTLPELLVVILIVGLLAALAIPGFSAQRQRSWAAAVISDVRAAAATADHTRLDGTDGGPPDALRLVTERSLEFIREADPPTRTGVVNLSRGVQLGYLTNPDDRTHFCVCGIHTRPPADQDVVFYDSATRSLGDQCSIPEHGCTAEATDLPVIALSGLTIGHSPVAIPGGHLLTDGSLDLGTVPGITGWGWGVAFGTWQGHNFTGYTPQLDQGSNFSGGTGGGQFVVRSWEAGSQANQPGEQLQAVDAKDVGLPDLDFTGAADVRADVRDGMLHLVVDGRTVLTQDHRDLVPDAGEFGVRHFARNDQIPTLEDHLDGDQATLTIRD